MSFYGVHNGKLTGFGRSFGAVKIFHVTRGVVHKSLCAFYIIFKAARAETCSGIDTGT